MDEFCRVCGVAVEWNGYAWVHAHVPERDHEPLAPPPDDD